MDIDNIIFAFAFVGFFISMILYILFGQTTLRKLRKNPRTKYKLGLEFASGWDILNVAQALSLPKFVTRKLNKSAISYLYANTDILVKNTNVLDRIVARLLYWVLTASVLSVLSIAILFD